MMLAGRCGAPGTLAVLVARFAVDTAGHRLAGGFVEGNRLDDVHCNNGL